MNSPPHCSRSDDRPQHLEFYHRSSEQHLNLSADGYLCQTRDLWPRLVAAATPEHVDRRAMIGDPR